jgi:hypothetical protein
MTMVPESGLSGLGQVCGEGCREPLFPTPEPAAMNQSQFDQQDPVRQHAAPGSGDVTVDWPGRTEEVVQPHALADDLYPVPMALVHRRRGLHQPMLPDPRGATEHPSPTQPDNALGHAMMSLTADTYTSVYPVVAAEAAARLVPRRAADGTGVTTSSSHSAFTRRKNRPSRR